MNTRNASFHIKAELEYKTVGRIGNLDRKHISEENLCFTSTFEPAQIQELIKLVLTDARKLRIKLIKEGRSFWANDIRIRFRLDGLGTTGNLVPSSFFWSAPFAGNADSFRGNLYSGGREKIVCSFPTLEVWALAAQEVFTVQVQRGFDADSVNPLWAPSDGIADFFHHQPAAVASE